jgi:hypothetical protein
MKTRQSNHTEGITLDFTTAFNTKAGIACLTFALGGGTGTVLNRYADTPTREQYAILIKGQDETVRLLQSFDARLQVVEQEHRDERLKQDILEKQRRR